MEPESSSNSIGDVTVTFTFPTEAITAAAEGIAEIVKAGGSIYSIVRYGHDGTEAPDSPYSFVLEALSNTLLAPATPIVGDVFRSLYQDWKQSRKQSAEEKASAGNNNSGADAIHDPQGDLGSVDSHSPGDAGNSRQDNSGSEIPVVELDNMDSRIYDNGKLTNTHDSPWFGGFHWKSDGELVSVSAAFDVAYKGIKRRARPTNEYSSAIYWDRRILDFVGCTRKIFMALEERPLEVRWFRPEDVNG